MHDPNHSEQRGTDAVSAAVSALAHSLCAGADTFGAEHPPMLWWVHASDTAGDPSQLAVRFTLSDPVPLPGLLNGLRGLWAPDDAVGLALVITSDATFTPKGATAPLPDRVRVRFATAMLRDGTAAGFSAIAGGGSPAQVWAATGRVAAHLNRVLGLPSGADPTPERMWAARCWLWGFTTRAAELGSASVAAELLETETRAATFVGVPSAFGAAARAAAAGDRWDDILVSLRAVAHSSGASSAPGSGDTLALLGWLDADMLAAEFSMAVPSFEDLAQAWERLGATAPCEFSVAADTALAAVGL